MNTQLIPQLSNLLLFALAGMSCAAVSDLFFVLWQIWRGRISTAVFDFLLMLLTSLTLFLLTVSVVQDNLRGYMLCSMALSAFLWEKTAGKLLRFLSLRLVHLLSAPMRRAAKLLRCIVRLPSKTFQTLKNKKISKKQRKIEKNPSIFYDNGIK